jgi:hypothetical protein
MIIQGAEGDDLARIEDMERDLCRKYKVRRKLLYPILQQADFHRTYQDPPEFWTAPAYAAFSAVLLAHELAFKQLKSLISDFTTQRLLMDKSWAAVATRHLIKNESERTYRNHVAIAHRYACCVANDYSFPEPYLLGRFTIEQYLEFNSYLEYVTRCLIPAGKHARLACARQLNDQEKSHHAMQPDTLGDLSNILMD